jgi:hypothetical protein
VVRSECSTYTNKPKRQLRYWLKRVQHHQVVIRTRKRKRTAVSTSVFRAEPVGVWTSAPLNWWNPVGPTQTHIQRRELGSRETSVCSWGWGIASRHS